MSSYAFAPTNRRVRALVCEPAEPTCSLGVLYFNNVGPIGMCGHGTIGLMTTLASLGRIKPGTHRIDTVVGVVSAPISGVVGVINAAITNVLYTLQARIDQLQPAEEQAA